MTSCVHLKKRVSHLGLVFYWEDGDDQYKREGKGREEWRIIAQFMQAEYSGDMNSKLVWYSNGP